MAISNTSLSKKTIIASEKLSVPRTQVTDTSTPVRRSGNYPPSLWSYDKIQSLTSEYTGDKHKPRWETLKEAARTMISKVFEEKTENPLKILNLVDDLQRLGIYYHFENEISNVLKNIYYNYYDTPEKWTELGLNLKALGFRLLRQHGYHIPQEVFEGIKDEAGNFKRDKLQKDTEGMLNLYEASYFSVEDEDILDDARDFTTKYLKETLEENNIDGDEYLSSLISHALDIPLNWMVPRVETRWFIEAYETRTDMNSTLLQFAKLDFNIVQAIHLGDLKDASEWWANISWNSNLSFVRDRVVECFLWTIGVNPLPQFSSQRRILARVIAMITTFDDIYDVYGTLEELEQFTKAICRWDINLIDELPEYMKLCFIGFYNSINEIACYTLTQTGFFNLPYLKKAWENLCKAYLKEAQWYHNSYMPTLEEYLETAYMSISVPLVLTHISFITSVSSTEEILHSMEGTEKIIRYSALILRLADDLGTSSEEVARGDTPKSVECYMHETGVTKEEGRKHVKKLILDA